MFDFHQSVCNEYGEQDEDKIYEYMNGLLAEFGQSPEAQPVRDQYGGCGWAASMMEYGFNYVGTAPAEMTPGDFEEVVFELFPRKISTEPDRAGEIVTELRAFWSFVSRQYGSDNARAILAVLDDDASNRLHKEMADPTKYGMAKSFFMLGSKSGFDMTTPQGLAAFQAVYNAQVLASQSAPSAMGRLPDVPKLSALPRPPGDDLKKRRKEKRKQREAKKRNRHR